MKLGKENKLTLFNMSRTGIKEEIMTFRLALQKDMGHNPMVSHIFFCLVIAW